MDKIQHKNIPIFPGLNIHVAEIGHGPVVLFLHGFPDLWYTWRHQMVYLAGHGYRAVAPDLRGYGDTTGPLLQDPSKFTVLHLAGDVILLLDAIAPNEDKVFVVGHDLGAFVAWRLCLYRPDKIRAVVNFGVPFNPIDPGMNPVEMFRELYGDDHYIYRFQEPGEIESEFERMGLKKIINYFLAFHKPHPYLFPKGKGLSYSSTRPPWLTEDDLDSYTTKFKQTGLTGGLNYYRAFGLNWELNGPWVGSCVNVPVKFITGELDPSYHIPGAKEFIHGDEFKKLVPKLEEVVVVDGVAHFVHQERAEEVNQLVYDFLKKF